MCAQVAHLESEVCVSLHLPEATRPQRSGRVCAWASGAAQFNEAALPLRAKQTGLSLAFRGPHRAPSCGGAFLMVSVADL